MLISISLKHCTVSTEHVDPIKYMDLFYKLTFDLSTPCTKKLKRKCSPHCCRGHALLHDF